MLFPLLHALFGGSLAVSGLVCSCLFLQCKPKTKNKMYKTILPPAQVVCVKRQKWHLSVGCGINHGQGLLCMCVYDIHFIIFLPCDASAERGNAIVSRLSVCL